MAKKNLRIPPPTYRAIQEWVKAHKSYTPRSCWIASVKREMGYDVKKSPNRIGAKPKNPCPEAKIADIEEAINKA
jgi:hypothetical protein